MLSKGVCPKRVIYRGDLSEVALSKITYCFTACLSVRGSVRSLSPGQIGRSRPVQRIIDGRWREALAAQSSHKLIRKVAIPNPS